MATYLMTWNPDIWDERIAGTIGWSTGRTNKIILGDRLFLMRQVTRTTRRMRGRVVRLQCD